MNENQDTFGFNEKAAAEPGTPLPVDLEIILSYLTTYCCGVDNAQPAAYIAQKLGYKGNHPDRKLRALINSHYADLPVMVIGLGAGFYISDDPDILTHKRAELHARLKALSTRLHDFDEAARRLGFEKEGIGEHVVFSRRAGPESRSHLAEKHGDGRWPS